jgi:Family of unknown function (DUF6232)
MQETTFFSERNVLVTNARFVVNNQTYALSGITSVKIFQEPRPVTIPFLMSICGLGMIAAGSQNNRSDLMVGGVMLIALGIALGWYSKGQAHLIIHSASGEVRAITTTDAQFVTKVHDALSKAIVFRASQVAPT